MIYSAYRIRFHIPLLSSLPYSQAKELLEQMDLEVHNLSSSEKPRYKGRVRSYQQDLGNLEKDFRKSRIALSAKAREQLVGGWNDN